MPRKQLHVFMIDGMRLVPPEIVDWAEASPYACKMRATGVKTMQAVLAPHQETAQHLRWCDQNDNSWNILSSRKGNSRWWNPLDGLKPRTQPVPARRRPRKCDVWL
jgi:hypothetical protein